MWRRACRWYSGAQFYHEEFCSRWRNGRVKFYLFLFSAFFLLLFTVQASAQAPAKRPPLPADLAKYVDEYPVELMKVPAVKSRLKLLLGKRYADFDVSISVQAPMKMDGDFLFASGCMAHACTIMEAAFV